MRRLDEERNGEGMIDKPEYIITFANLQGLEGAGLDETGETFATDDSRLEFVKEICKEVRSRPYTAPAEQEIRDKVLKGLAGRMRIYEHELQEKYNKTDNIISFTEVETVKKTFEWIDKQIVELRTLTPEAQP